MLEYLPDEVHRLLDIVETEIREINASPNREIDVDDLGSLCLVILELLGWTSTAYMENTLSISPSLLSKFVKMRGKVRKDLALQTAHRLRTHLRSLDQASPTIAPNHNTRPPTSTIPPEEADGGAELSLTIAADQWVLVPAASPIRKKISIIATLLESIVEQVERANLPEGEQALTAIEKAELIAILNTALAVLNAPLVERGILKKAANSLHRSAERTVEKKVQEGMGQMMTATGERLLEIILKIFGGS